MKSNAATAPAPTIRDRFGLKAPPKAPAAVVPFPAATAAPELTDDEREAFAIELVTDPDRRKVLNEARERRRFHRLGITVDNEKRAQRNLPPIPLPAGPGRPYFVDTFPALPSPQMVAEVFTAAGLDASGIAALIAPDERKWLRKKQAKINEVNDQMRRLDIDGIRAMAREAETRLKRGKGSRADAEFDKGNLVAARKELRKQRERIVQECASTLVKVAERIQSAARKALPVFEAEAQRLKINPALLPMVQAAAALCYMPETAAKNALESPKTWLKTRFGIRL